jgi:acetyl-CoA carboxylase biotin carboxyl carrier protein
MSEQALSSVLSWMKQTDLVEVFYKNDGDTLSLTIEDAQGSIEIPPATLVPVPAPAIGVFRLGAPGRAAETRKGGAVKRGAKLGVIESGEKKIDVEAPSDGRIVELLAHDGQAVEYGRPLLLIEP